MKRKIMGIFLTLVLILGYCLVVVTPVAADEGDNENLANSVSSICQFEGNLWYQSDLNYSTFEGTVEMLDDGSVEGYANSSYIICDNPDHLLYGYYAAGWEYQEVIEATIVEVDSESAVLILMKTVTSGAIHYPQSPIAGEYSVSLIVDGHNPHSGEDYILGIDGINGENEAKSIYDNYLATGDVSGLSLIDTANCNVVIK